MVGVAARRLRGPLAIAVARATIAERCRHRRSPTVIACPRRDAVHADYFGGIFRYWRANFAMSPNAGPATVAP